MKYIFLWVVFFLLIGLQGCSNRDSELELALTKVLIQHKTDNVMSIDLRTIFGTQWKKACRQGPYIGEIEFEQLIGEDVRGFDVLDDDRYAIWVFYSDGHTSLIEIKRSIMDSGGGGVRCASIQHPFIYFKVMGGEKKYFFNNAGDRK